MKRLTILWIIVLMGVMMVSCRKQEEVTISHIINTEAYSDYDSMQTVVTVTATCEQGGTEKAPVGTAYLILSPTKDMLECETLDIQEYSLNQTCRFKVSELIRPLDSAYWYYVEIQMPYSTPLRSEICEIPVVPHHSFLLRNGSYIKFAPGNMQYKASTNTWRFAEHQYDKAGKNNENISATYDDWIDLFGYGTSGFEYQPYNSALVEGMYANGWIDKTYSDWGIYYYIINGGYLWRTPIEGEWLYITNGRPNAKQHRSLATVNNVKGLILLPEDWNLPSGCDFIPDRLYYNDNNYNLEEWEKMENAGAVFLPATGYRIKRTIYDEDKGYYYSVTWYDRAVEQGVSGRPMYFYFAQGEVISCTAFAGTGTFNAYGHPVRPIRTVKE